jgi:hypothetical protein
MAKIPGARQVRREGSWQITEVVSQNEVVGRFVTR